MKHCKTEEQFDEIVKDTLNCHWKKATLKCVQYGFYAEDLIQMNEMKKVFGTTFRHKTDIAILIERATEFRCRK